MERVSQHDPAPLPRCCPRRRVRPPCRRRQQFDTKSRYLRVRPLEHRVREIAKLACHANAMLQWSRGRRRQRKGVDICTWRELGFSVSELHARGGSVSGRGLVLLWGRGVVRVRLEVCTWN